MGYTLGIDVGVSSLGVAVIRENEPPKLYVRIFRSPSLGGKNTLNSLETGSDVATRNDNPSRRQYRHQRRQIDRRRRRMAKLFHQLQKAGLLPAGNSKTPLKRDEIIKDLDGNKNEGLLCKLLVEIKEKNDGNIKSHNVPYILRALALERELQPFELGRALYHLGQRRGYKNIGEKDGEDESGKVNDGIGRLDDKLGNRTMGQYFASIHSDKSGKIRIKPKMTKTGSVESYPFYTSRKMYKDEFNRIWAAQVEFWKRNTSVPAKDFPLNLDFRRLIYKTIFHQRPLKSQAGKIGYCGLEQGKRRAPECSLEFQRFRYWSVINNIRVLTEDDRPLTLEEKQLLARYLESGELRQVATAKRDVKVKEAESNKTVDKNGKEHRPSVDGLWQFFWREVRDLLKIEPPKPETDLLGKVIPKKKGKKQKEDNNPDNFIFNLEQQKDTIPSNVVAAGIIAVYPEFAHLTDDKQCQFVTILDESTNWRSIKRKLAKELVPPITDEQAKALFNTAENFPSDYASYSLTALRELLPLLSVGKTLTEALDEKYPNRNDPGEPQKFVPPVKLILPDINNPTVIRSLTELRKVVNTVLRQEGEKPECSRIELTRILKVGRKQRKEKHEAMVEKRTDNDRIYRLLSEICDTENVRVQYKYKDSEKKHPTMPSCEHCEFSYTRPASIPKDWVLKYKLWEECGAIDPYTGNTICLRELFGLDGNPPRYEIEHIYPLSVSFDNSFQNLTLCDRNENNTKGKKTPWEAYHSDPQRWREILIRVKKWGSKNETEDKDGNVDSKWVRFNTEHVPEGFANRQLNDTAYIATAAVKLLATLYGGHIEKGIHNDKGTQRIFVVPGQAMERLRRFWGLDSLLPKTLGLQEVQTIAGYVKGWQDMTVDEKVAVIRQEAAEYRIEWLPKEETLKYYIATVGDKKTKNEDSEQEGENEQKDKKEKTLSRARKNRGDHRHHAIDAFVIANCTPEMIRMWADAEEQGDTKRKDWRFPYPIKDCRRVVKQAVDGIIVSHRPERKVSGGLHGDQAEKVGKSKSPLIITANDRTAVDRHIKPDTAPFHHVDVYETRDKKGKIKWDVCPVKLKDLYDAVKPNGKKTANNVYGSRPLFSLCKGDIVRIVTDDKGVNEFRIFGILGNGSVKLLHINDARSWNAKHNNEYQEKYGVGVNPSLSSLQGRLEPVTVDVLGGTN